MNQLTVKHYMFLRKNIWQNIFMVLVAILLCGCGKNTENEATFTQQPDTNIAENLPTSELEIILPTSIPESSLPIQAVEQEKSPDSNDEVYLRLMEKWQAGKLSGLYSYASDEMKALVDEEQFYNMFLGLSDTFGTIVKIENEKSVSEGGNTTYTATLFFKHAEAYIQVYICNSKIAGYNYDVRFVTDFENKLENGITEYFFLLKTKSIREEICLI